jgi:CBS domain-containing protein
VNPDANPSQAIGAEVDQAASLAELKAAAARVDEMVRRLHASGTHIEQVAARVSEANTRIFARLWTLLAPDELRANSCLLAMGSEGRGEQILKTDQDNALLVRDGFEWPQLREVARQFNAALIELGWPPCPGDIMLTNPAWCQPQASFRETMRGWVYGQGRETAQGPMHLAIFFDATAVAGDASLLEEARAYLERIVGDADTFLARFAAAADQFPEPGGWLARWTAALGGGRDEAPLDLKKLGIFPIVHGVRALSLEAGVRARGTVERLAALAAAGRLRPAQASELRDALWLLMGVRLTHQLAQRERGEPVGNEVRSAELSAPDRQSLREALATVKAFRAFLRRHFRLDML